MSRPAGIDLGTTYSAIAVIDDYGKPVVVPNLEGERITPSVVMVNDDGSVVVGTAAKNSATSDPYSVVQFVKRSMGDPNYSFHRNGKYYSAEDISAFILRKLKQDAERALNEEIRDVVITVPAYFDDVRRSATVNAGSIAGLNVIRIINEPTAAALGYGSICSQSKPMTVMVYDLGGGTFDVTVMKIREKEIQVIATDGDHMLGGTDFDDRIMAYVNEAFREKYGEDLFADLEIQQDLRQRCEAAKRTLSTRDSAKVNVSAFGRRLTVEMTRTQFENETKDLMARTEMLVQSVLKSASMNWSSIESVLLVGGSTRMPMVSHLLRRMSGKEPLMSVNPDEAVALGAAVQACIVGAQKGEKFAFKTTAGQKLANTVVSDVTSHAFGILVTDIATSKLVNMVIIPKNHRIPCKIEDSVVTLAPNQVAVDFIVLQGHDRDPDNCSVIGKTVLEFGAAKPKGYPVKVIYEYDSNMMMHGTLIDEATGRKAVLHIDQPGRLSQAEVEQRKKIMTQTRVE